MKNNSFELIATAPMGLESIVARELHDLGYTDTKTDNGRVTFRGGLLDICRTNLWLRTADRVLVKMGEFEARTFEELFQGTKALPWAEWIPAHGEFPVNGKSRNSQLSSVPACQSIVKKAIVEHMKEHYHREWFDENGPRYVIEVSLVKDRALLTLDTTGPSLHKRGYRKLVTEAPLKETLAAALVLLSRWNVDQPLHDPFCGSGTIPIEAALIGWNVAPGLRRTFSAETWPIIPEDLWQEAREEAFDLVKDDSPLHIYGSDIDPQSIEVAQAAAKSAGLSKEISLRNFPVSKLYLQGDFGCVITNPPYGERLGTASEADQAIRELSAAITRAATWSTYIISPNRDMEHLFGRPANKNRKLYNGRIECHYYQFFGPRRSKNTFEQ